MWLQFSGLHGLNSSGREGLVRPRMWGCVSQLDVPYEVRHMMRFKDKHQRPLTDREKEIIARVKAESKPVTGRPGVVMPNIKVVSWFTVDWLIWGDWTSASLDVPDFDRFSTLSKYVTNLALHFFLKAVFWARYDLLSFWHILGLSFAKILEFPECFQFFVPKRRIWGFFCSKFAGFLNFSVKTPWFWGKSFLIFSFFVLCVKVFV